MMPFILISFWLGAFQTCPSSEPCCGPYRAEKRSTGGMTHTGCFCRAFIAAQAGVGKVAPRLSRGFGSYTILESNMRAASIASEVASRHFLDINRVSRGYSVEEMDELVNLLADFIGLQFAQESPSPLTPAGCRAVSSWLCRNHFAGPK